MRLKTMLMTAWMCLAGALMPLPALAQAGTFAPVLIVNGSPITGYELSQRARFLQLLNAPGDLDKLAQQQLIQDRVQLKAAKDAGIVPTKDEIDAGMKEFAGRANMPVDQFVAQLGKAGVAEQTFRDFVKAGVAWRQLVQAKFGPEVSIGKADLDRALSVAAQQPATRLLLSEIIMPATQPYIDQTMANVQQIMQTVHTSGEFAAAARKFSASASAPRGGAIDWIAEDNLPPQVQNAVKDLKPGQMSSPVRIENAVGIFFLRAEGAAPGPAASDITVKYAQYLIPGGRSDKAMEAAAKVKARVDSCEDLYSVARGQSKGVLTFTTQVLTKVPGDIRMQLAGMDQNEISTALTKGGNLDLLMLCTRRPTEAETADPSDIQKQLFNQRLAGKAANYLAELEADAFIRHP